MDKKPKIRFKGFDDAWEQRKLGEVVDIYDGVHQTPDYKDSGIMFLSVENISTLKSEKYISEEDFKKYYKIYPQKNDILMTRIGDIGTPNVVEDNTPKAFYVSLALLKHKKTDPYFLSNAIQSGFVKEGLLERSLITAIPMKINKDEIGKVDVLYPKNEEQTKIGAFFSKLDNLITLHQRKYEKLKNVKKSMLEKMFPKNGSKFPEIRFKGFTDAWEQRKLGDNVQFYSGLTYSPHNIIGSDGTLVLRSSNVKNSEIVHADDVYVEPNIVNSENVKVGDVIVVVRNGSRSLIGKHAQIKEEMPSTVIGAFMTGVRYSCPEFLNALLSTSKFNKEIEKDLGATINQITTGSFKNMEFNFTNSKEETKIGTFFSKLDNLITLHQRKCEKLKNIKKSMLEKMFV